MVTKIGTEYGKNFESEETETIEIETLPTTKALNIHEFYSTKPLPAFNRPNIGGIHLPGLSSLLPGESNSQNSVIEDRQKSLNGERENAQVNELIKV